MIRKGFLMMVGVCFLTLFTICLYGSIVNQNEIQKVTTELSHLSQTTVESIGENPTEESIANAQKHLDEQKGQLQEKVQYLKTTGKIKEGSKEESKLFLVNENNLKNLLGIFDKLTERSDQNLEGFNKTIEQLNEVPQGSAQAKKLEKQLGEHTKSMKTISNLIKAMDNLVKCYETIISQGDK